MQVSADAAKKNIVREPMIAGILSFLFMGLGQAYNGQRRKGYLFFASYIGIAVLYFILIKVFNEPLPVSGKDIPVTSTAYVITFICSFLVWIFNIYDAYKSTKRVNENDGVNSIPGKSVLIFFRNIVLSFIAFFILMILIPVRSPVFGAPNVAQGKSAISLAPGWEAELVDTKKDTGGRSSIALDGNNNPHIAYEDEEGIRYACRIGPAWKIQTVEEGYMPSIALDSLCRPHISFSLRVPAPGYGNLLKYAYWDGSEWKITVVEQWGTENSLAIDANDRPHIAYCTNRGGVQYAFWTGSKWDIQTVDAGLIDMSADKYKGRMYVSLALDDQGMPHIAYFDQKNGDLKYAYYSEEQWHKQIVDNIGLVGLEPAIAIDKKGLPHIAYLDADAYDLKYAFWNGRNWDIQTIDREKNVGCKSVIALDKLERPHIVYSRCSDEELKYAFCNDDSWNIETIETRDIGYFTPVAWTISMCLDSDGKPHISCYDNKSRVLKYIRKL